MLEVGKNLNLEVRELLFSCKLRVELGPLVEILPAFGAISLSFMGKPHVDFSFQVGGIDVMNIGIASTDYSVAMLVGDYMKSSLEFMVYPKKYIIPMIDDCDIGNLDKVIPVGVLKPNHKICQNSYHRRLHDQKFRPVRCNQIHGQ